MQYGVRCSLLSAYKEMTMLNFLGTTYFTFFGTDILHLQGKKTKGKPAKYIISDFLLISCVFPVTNESISVRRSTDDAHRPTERTLS